MSDVVRSVSLLHDRVVMVSVMAEKAPHVPPAIPGMSFWRRRLFVGLSRNAASPAGAFHLPVERTVVMGSRVEL